MLAGPPFGFGGRGGAGVFGGDGSLTQVLAYVRRHGGGTIAVSSQSSAAAAITSQHASVAGIGGFSGRESAVSVSWLAQEVRAGRIRWVLDDQGGQGAGPRLPGDTRTGSRTALDAVAAACQKVSIAASAASTAKSAEASRSNTLYDCQGRTQQLLALAR